MIFALIKIRSLRTITVLVVSISWWKFSADVEVPWPCFCDLSAYYLFIYFLLIFIYLSFKNLRSYQVLETGSAFNSRWMVKNTDLRSSTGQIQLNSCLRRWVKNNQSLTTEEFWRLVTSTHAFRLMEKPHMTPANFTFFFLGLRTPQLTFTNVAAGKSALGNIYWDRFHFVILAETSSLTFYDYIRTSK